MSFVEKKQGRGRKSAAIIELIEVEFEIKMG